MLWPLFRPLLFRLPAEWTHYRAMGCLCTALHTPWLGPWLASRFRVDARGLERTVMGLRFPHPFGLAAGFDKAGLWYNELSQLGFGHVEIGTVTGQAQPGNPRPRLFRLPADRALLNRMGFNNPGATAVACRLEEQPKQTLLGINIGKSKSVENAEAISDYAFSFRTLYPYADYFTINVSSPNTPGLRALQDRQPLAELLGHLQRLNDELASASGGTRRPIVLKIAPDLSELQLDDIVEIVVATKLDGVIATNTTIGREGLRTPASRVVKLGAGGISGAPLTATSRRIVGWLRSRLPPRVALVGSGGIMTPADALGMLDSGADLVQVYTGFVYGGPRTVGRFVAAMQTRQTAFGGKRTLKR